MILDQVILETTPKTLRRFASLFLPLGTALIGGIVFLRWSQAAGTWIWVIGAALTAAALASPKTNRLVYFGLMAITFPIGWMVFHLLIAVVYLGVITPLGLVFRVAGRDSLALRKKAPSATYWAPRAPARRLIATSASTSRHDRQPRQLPAGTISRAPRNAPPARVSSASSGATCATLANGGSRPSSCCCCC